MALGRPRVAASLAIVVVAALLVSARPCRSETTSRLIVDRAEGAEQCPDEAALAERVRRIRERTDVGKARYRVAFSRSTTGLAVSITAEPSGRARALTSGDASCDAIANAAAVTLALLFDAEPSEPPASPAPAATPKAPPKKTSVEPHIAKSAVSNAFGMTLGASFVSVFGVSAPAAFGGALDVGLVTTRFRTSLGALRTAPVTTSLAPGTVREGLAGGTARACYAPVSRRLRLDACTGLLVGVTSATATGYARNETRDRPFLALPVELAGSWWRRWFGVELGAAALFPVVRHDFGIDGLGVPYRSSSVGATAHLTFMARLPL